MTSEAHTAILLQARLSSRRLPGKVLKRLGHERTLLEQILARLPSSRSKLVVATSELPSDDAIEEACQALKASCFRGPLEDVLGRFTSWLDAHPHITRLVRLTADNPLVDEALIARALEAFERRDASRFVGVSNHLPEHRTDPHGYAAEVVDAAALRELAASCHDAELREHVTLAMVRDGRIAPYAVYDQARSYRWTIDTPADHAYLDELFKELGDQVTASQALAWSRRHPHPEAELASGLLLKGEVPPPS